MKRALIILGLVAPKIDKEPRPPFDLATITIENVWFSGQPNGVLVDAPDFLEGLTFRAHYDHMPEVQ